MLKTIINFQDQIKRIDKKIYEIYDDLIKNLESSNNGIYFCDTKFIKDSVQETLDEINSLEDIQVLPEFYYNDNNGIELHCYLLHFDKNGIYIVDHEQHLLLNLTITEFNGIEEKLNILKTIVNSLK